MDTSVLKHRFEALGPVCLTQALFNFSFYGVRSIFVLYALQKFSLTASEAISLFAAFMALSYGTSLVGGHIADRGLGVKNTIVVGGAFSALGLLLVLFPSPDVRCLGLALASLGSGFFKPNIPTAAGLLFKDPQDPEKDKVFTLLYIAMNAGGLPASLACGFVGQTYGWHYGIILIALIFAFSTYFVCNTMWFHPSYRETLTWTKGKLLASLASLIVLLYLVFKCQAYFHSLMGLITCASLVCFGKILYACQPEERKDVWAIALYILLSALFGALNRMGLFMRCLQLWHYGRRLPGRGIPCFPPVGRRGHVCANPGGILDCADQLLAHLSACARSLQKHPHGVLVNVDRLWPLPGGLYRHILLGDASVAASLLGGNLFERYQLFFIHLDLFALCIGVSLLVGQGVKFFSTQYRDKMRSPSPSCPMLPSED